MQVDSSTPFPPNVRKRRFQQWLDTVVREDVRNLQERAFQGVHLMLLTGRGVTTTLDMNNVAYFEKRQLLQSRFPTRRRPGNKPMSSRTPLPTRGGANGPAPADPKPNNVIGSRQRAVTDDVARKTTTEKTGYFQKVPNRNQDRVITPYRSNNSKLGTNIYYICTVVEYPMGLWRTPYECIQWIRSWELQRDRLRAQFGQEYQGKDADTDRSFWSLAGMAGGGNAEQPPTVGDAGQRVDYFHKNLKLVLQYLFPTNYFHDRPSNSFDHQVNKLGMPFFEMSMLTDTARITAVPTNELVFHQTWMNDLLNLPYLREWFHDYKSVRSFLLNLYQQHRNLFNVMPGNEHEPTVWNDIVREFEGTMVKAEFLRPLPFYPNQYTGIVASSWNALHSNKYHARDLIRREDFKNLQRRLNQMANMVNGQPFWRAVSPFYELIYRGYFEQETSNWSRLLLFCEYVIHPTRVRQLPLEYLYVPATPILEGNHPFMAVEVVMQTMHGDLNQLPIQKCRVNSAIQTYRTTQETQSWPLLAPPTSYPLLERGTSIQSILWDFFVKGRAPQLTASEERARTGEETELTAKPTTMNLTGVHHRVLDPTVDADFSSSTTTTATTRAAAMDLSNIPPIPQESFFANLEPAMQAKNRNRWAALDSWMDKVELEFLKQVSAKPTTEGAVVPVLSRVYLHRAQYFNPRGLTWLETYLRSTYALAVQGNAEPLRMNVHVLFVEMLAKYQLHLYLHPSAKDDANRQFLLHKLCYMMLDFSYTLTPVLERLFAEVKGTANYVPPTKTKKKK